MNQSRAKQFRSNVKPGCSDENSPAPDIEVPKTVGRFSSNKHCKTSTFPEQSMPLVMFWRLDGVVHSALCAAPVVGWRARWVDDPLAWQAPLASRLPARE